VTKASLYLKMAPQLPHSKVTSTIEEPVSSLQHCGAEQGVKPGAHLWQQVPLALSLISQLGTSWTTSDANSFRRPPATEDGHLFGFPGRSCAELLAREGFLLIARIRSSKVISARMPAMPCGRALVAEVATAPLAAGAG
jgi:hypothetical protein